MSFFRRPAACIAQISRTHDKHRVYTTVGGTNYSYDENGNLTSDGTYTYSYDDKNRLKSVYDGQNKLGEYWYDYQGRRVRRYHNGAYDKYAYDGDQVIMMLRGPAEVIKRKFVYGPGIDEPICMIDVEDNNAVYYYHYDGLGSVVALSDSNKDMVERYTYKVFGEVEIHTDDGDDNTWLTGDDTISSSSAKGNPYFFTGRRYDDESKLYYYRARYYNTAIGKFMQPDPIRYKAGLNLYTYCGNNPVMLTDPNGLWTLNIGGAYGIGGTVSIGHNNGRWSIGFNIGFGAGAMASLDPGDSPTTKKNDDAGWGPNATIQAQGKIGKVGAGVSGNYTGSLYDNGAYQKSTLSGSLGPASGSANFTSDETCGSADHDISGSAGVEPGLGAMGFVGVGGHVDW